MFCDCLDRFGDADVDFILACFVGLRFGCYEAHTALFDDFDVNLTGFGCAAGAEAVFVDGKIHFYSGV